ncbi:hypothetical protein QN416_24610, partial [Glaciimonas sp. Cout2]|uniref:hypothetical protein n=1 Tax=Glaciimonas sp. Cout2 TaxID=3048621 RepID=UPI002B23E1F8
VIIVIDPVSSARQYGPEIRRKGYYAVALVTRERFPGRLHNLHCVDGFDEVIRVSDLADAQAKLQGVAVRAIIPGSDSALKISDKLADHFFVVG